MKIDNVLGKATIMVVDDTPANLKLLQDMLQSNGYRVLAFTRGTMALKAAARNSPDLILLDINMPEMGGFEVCEHLKADETLKAVPVIFISALAETMDKVKAFLVGGVDYVTKPFQFEEVLARINAHLTLRRLQIELEQHNHHLQELVQEQVREISESQMATIFALAKLAEFRDDDTGTHLERVQKFCKLLAMHICNNSSCSTSVDAAFVENICHASPLHDIGKVGISDAILLKPGKLTLEEFKLMKQHTVIGAQTLETARNQYPRNAFINMGIDVARSHHERWDGTGYPDGLTGIEIPLSARIMAVADVYDALRSKRCYKEAFTHETSRDIILQGRGTQFDPAVVDAFIALEHEFNSVRTAMDNE
ncbi:MAG TPA: response regulator [Desulfuromonadaceae bacterium]